MYETLKNAVIELFIETKNNMDLTLKSEEISNAFVCEAWDLLDELADKFNLSDDAVNVDALEKVIAERDQLLVDYYFQIKFNK